MMTAPSYFLVAGATGRQGGSAVKALINDEASPVKPERIFAITRDLHGAGAAKIAGRGIKLVVGNLGQPAAIFEHLRAQGVDLHRVGVFLAQAHGPTELNDACGFIDAAVHAGVRHFVYSSVDRGGKELSDKDPSPCKTFSDKFKIEKHLIAATTSSGSDSDAKSANKHTSRGTDYTILRPTWFADNADWGFPGKLCMTGWRENMRGKRMQVTVTKDIGRWAAEALLRPDRAGLRNEAISIASDYLSFQEVDEIFRQETGRSVEVTWGWLTRLVIWLVTDLRTMFAFINDREYGADLETLARIVPPTTFRQWVRENARSQEKA
jgi:uncharacterized protein YbjT (DUF2867 family)